MITVRYSIRSIGLALLSLFVMASVAHADITELFGTWQGTATPTFRFTGNNVQFGSPPYMPYSIQLIMHSYDPINDNFGTHASSSGSPDSFRQSGIINSLTDDTGNVTMVTFFPQEGNPTGYSDFIGLLSGNTLTGMFSDRSPAPPGLIHEQTTVSLTRVAPEPSSAVMLLSAAGGVAAWRLRRRRSD